ITVHGHVNDSPCDITSGGVSGGNVDINYNEVSKHTITTTASHEHQFTIHLENCVLPTASVGTPKVSITFKSTKTLADMNHTMDADHGVGVQITDNNTSTHNLVDLSGTKPIEFSFPAQSSTSLDLKFATQLIQFNSQTIDTGDFSATATYTLTYS
ncbi:type 1 fimbrial protein, partial [Salmonella enterica subsp. enterica serovar Hvittingfoss]|nr:type 1 fimbrial protein [Salmonella enterica subsp. enterica serovar Hvittingfoss]